LERRSLFSGWQAVGSIDQLRDTGNYITAEIAGEPVAVIRGDDGTLRAFSNVCRHRAAILLSEDAGQVAKIRCRYHGWTYDLAGNLRGAPEFDGVCDFDRDANGLPPWSVATWGPTLWVHANPNATPLPELIAQMQAKGSLDNLHWAARRVYELDCNWKVYVDNYLDGGYHINTVHPNLAGVLDYSKYRIELFPNACLQSSPLVPADGIGSVRAGDMAQYWWVFPNFMLNLYEGVMDTNVVYPLGPDRCRVVFDFYFAGQSDDFIRDSLDVAERVQHEDMQICAEVQRGLRSRSFDTGRYSVKREAGVHLFHRLLADQLRTAARH